MQIQHFEQASFMALGLILGRVEDSNVRKTAANLIMEA
jgi:hypothetical protein